MKSEHNPVVGLVLLAGLFCSFASAQQWTAQYDCDVAPDNAEPAWFARADEGGTFTTEDGILRMTTTDPKKGGCLLAIGNNTPGHYLKEDSWGAAEAWDASRPTTLEFRMRVVEMPRGMKHVCQVQLSDGQGYFYLFFRPEGLCDAGGRLQHALDTTTFHTYRVTLKERIPNLYIDGEPAPISCFQPGYEIRNALLIGDLSSSSAGTSQWDYVRWTNSEATPWEKKPFANATVDKGTVWINPLFDDITPDVNYPSWGGGTPAKLPDDRVLAVYSGPVGIHSPLGSTRVHGRITSDGGKTWGPEREIAHHPECQAGGPFAFTARDGVVRVIYMGWYRSVWRNNQPDMEQTRSDLWCIESHDGGKTWTNDQMIFKGYTGATNGAIQTDRGHILVPLSYLVADPGRLVSACVISPDSGQTWKLGECIDLGGHGDHAGALEPAVVQLKDGRVWMLIRTTAGHFWQAFSSDQGQTWSEPIPTEIESPSAPGHVIRLASGRLALVWNNTMQTTKGRDTLSLAFSDDEGKTWTSPIDCAKARQVSYPFLFERKPGVLWVGVHNVNAGFRNLALVFMAAREADLLSASE